MSAHEVQAQTLLITGNELVKWMQEHDKYERGDPGAGEVKASAFMGYIMGIHDATLSKYSIPEGATRSQLGAVVSKFLKENPEQWSYSASLLVQQALMKAFPKSEVK
jgi:hypothetical protein